MRWWSRQNRLENVDTGQAIQTLVIKVTQNQLNDRTVSVGSDCSRSVDIRMTHVSD